jgi:hypothetical protein
MGLIDLARSNSGQGKTFNNSSSMNATTLSFPSTWHGEINGNGDDGRNMSRMMARITNKVQSRDKMEEKPCIMSNLAGGKFQIRNPSEHTMGSNGVKRHHYFH